jgi:hypothetical protein
MISPVYQSQKEEDFGFKTHPRISHLRKLYLLLFLQWSMAALITILAIQIDDFNDFLLENPIIFAISIIFLIIIIAMTFIFRSVASQFPLNILLYLLFSIGLAFSFAYAAIDDNSNACFMILISLWAVSLSLFIYVLTTKCEITYQGATLFILAAIFLVLEWFLFYTTTSVPVVFLVLIGAVIWGFYLIYDTQTIVSGVKYDWNKDDYVSGAVGIYMDVMVLGLRLCELLKNLVVRDRT